ncbi:hypothetical protein SKM54_04400 [Acinetobacter faecalis]|uniref:hypothetical protein n=1 Tax=Acinetobacter faecalis TaxID=2665161 RepID=UPI002A90DFE9|nr:hypothetical protein [Acinetobacter faecalis]MDY6481690.1 hypothetical protein [Acinetobacter faecalis]
MSNATQIVDSSGPVAYGTGTGLTLLSWLNTWDWGFLVGVGIGFAGLIISFQNYRTNKRFQKRKDQREQELHEINMRKALEQCNAEQD